MKSNPAGLLKSLPRELTDASLFFVAASKAAFRRMALGVWECAEGR